jgi:hypothetical protein
MAQRTDHVAGAADVAGGTVLLGGGGVVVGGCVVVGGFGVVVTTGGTTGGACVRGGLDGRSCGTVVTGACVGAGSVVGAGVTATVDCGATGWPAGMMVVIWRGHAKAAATIATAATAPPTLTSRAGLGPRRDGGRSGTT